MPQIAVCRCGFSLHRTGTTEILTQRVEAGEAKTGGLSVNRCRRAGSHSISDLQAP